MNLHVLASVISAIELRKDELTETEAAQVKVVSDQFDSPNTMMIAEDQIANIKAIHNRLFPL